MSFLSRLKGFDAQGYTYDAQASSESELVFTRPQPPTRPRPPAMRRNL